MKRNFRRILSVLCVGIVCGTAACADASGQKTIVVAMPLASASIAWQAVADAYMELHPDVNVIIDDRDASSYVTWVTNAWATGSAVPADIVAVHHFKQYISDGKFVNLDDSLNKINPYMEKADGTRVKWKDGLDPRAYTASLDNKLMDYGTVCISADEVQVAWFYNKDIFRRAGLYDEATETYFEPRTWDEFLWVCDKIQSAPVPADADFSVYAPLSIGGSVQALDFTTGWLLRIYADQYFRDLEPLAAVNEKDYNFDEERDGSWVFDASDVDNDRIENIGFNPIRLASFAKKCENGFGIDSPKYRELLSNFKEMFTKYALQPYGFFIADTGLQENHFYNARAAMVFDGSWFVNRFPKNMEAEYQTGYKQFDYGYFFTPPMGTDVSEDGSLVRQQDSLVGSVYTRSMGGATGYAGVIDKKDRAKNELAVDFLMFYASPQGQKARFDAMLENGISPDGNCLVYDVEMPEIWRNRFASLPYRGEADYNPATSFCNGWFADQRSQRDFVADLQDLYRGKTDLDAALKSMQAALSGGIDRWVASSNYRGDALENPSRNPAK